MTNDDVRDTARRATQHDSVQLAARLGYLATGILHIVLAVLALGLAWGSQQTDADQSGAFATLTRSGGGRVLLWVLIAGFAGLAVRQALAAVAGRDGADPTDRGKDAAKAVLYASLAFSAFGFGAGSRGGSGDRTGSLTADLMAAPGGRLAVAAVGLAVLAVGGFHLVKGLRRTFLEDLTEHPGTWAVWAGIVGYATKGIALGIVGVLFDVAAWTARAGEAEGLDGALRTLREQPLGPWLLTAVAVGFGAYGLYSAARARYART